MSNEGSDIVEMFQIQTRVGKISIIYYSFFRLYNKLYIQYIYKNTIMVWVYILLQVYLHL